MTKVISVIILAVLITAIGIFCLVLGGIMGGPEAEPSSVFVAVMGALLILASSIISVSEVNGRWSEWSVCEDGETQAENVIITDCDEYYKFPGEPDGSKE